MILLSVDPGDHVGYALWEDWECYENGVMYRGDFLQTIADGHFDGVTDIVAEDFRLFKKRAAQQVGSRMPASYVLGALELFARQKGLWLTKQEPSILSTAALHAGIKMPAGHCPDDLSAYLHGGYYLESKDLLNPDVWRNLDNHHRVAAGK